MGFPDLQHCNHLGICQKCKFSGQAQTSEIRHSGGRKDWPAICALTRPCGWSCCELQSGAPCSSGHQQPRIEGLVSAQTPLCLVTSKWLRIAHTHAQPSSCLTKRHVFKKAAQKNLPRGEPHTPDAFKGNRLNRACSHLPQNLARISPTLLCYLPLNSNKRSSQRFSSK